MFVHNHTHLVDWRQSVLELTRLGRTVIVHGFSPVRNALSPVVINGGPWQRTITPVQFGRLQAENGLSDGELLSALRPAHLAPCYGFVQIDPYDDPPMLPAIRYWRQAGSGDWEMAGPVRAAARAVAEDHAQRCADGIAPPVGDHPSLVERGDERLVEQIREQNSLW